ncbi:uracil-DNA glycosylase [Azospirillum lipoferum]|uniref:Uracil-DNA glycosylase n=2 Tax=Azospirillaceae TaxID=2829815 RepID=A0A5A9GCH6_AZOLI|nr:uracil-DNA glycosylase [Azospirillum lipoferum]
MRLPAVFNPYHDRCLTSDREDAPKIRRNNLVEYMRAAEGRVSSVWFGRDLGYRGGRRTGLALTDEQHLTAFSERYGGISVVKATCGPIVGERTATVVWGVIRQMPTPPFLWNVFPFHPHTPGDPMSNRCHTPSERRSCATLLSSLIDWLQPERIVAIGNDAYKGLTDMGYSATCVRHPSYGGQTDFIRGIREIYGLSSTDSLPHQQSLF